ncbi:MAG: hypothetical protein DMG17_16060 [Acidobacteria bacterium]|nr:MAG: hypothetical protein DMG17_16060 [Acidobacteriota bacterium]
MRLRAIALALAERRYSFWIRVFEHEACHGLIERLVLTTVEALREKHAGLQKLLEETSMEIDAGTTNSERPTPSETRLRAPNWLVRVIEALIPPGPGSANEIIDVLLETHGSVAQAVLRIPALIAVPALGWAREVFYWKMAIAQAAILVLPFIDILSLPLVLNLGLVLAVLIIRDGYIRKNNRLDCEAITTFMTPALVILFNETLRSAFPNLMISGDAIIQRAFKLALPIALCRYALGKDPGPGHPHQDLLRLGRRTWFFNGLWAAGALAVISTNVQAVPPILQFQEFLTTFLTVHTFTLGWRLQLNPLEGISLHRRIEVTLNRDPYIGDLRRTRYFLLTGADWFSGFSAQAVLEMIFFALLPIPLLIGLAELYFGHPGAAEIHGLQMAANSAACVALLATWTVLKKLNRQTAAAFDEQIQQLLAK